MSGDDLSGWQHDPDNPAGPCVVWKTWPGHTVRWVLNPFVASPRKSTGPTPALVNLGEYNPGPLQACDIASILGLDTVLIPPAPGNLSAFGLLAVDLKEDYVTTLVRRHDEVDAEEVGETFDRLEAAALASLAAQGAGRGRIRLVPAVDVRYLGEAHEISIEARRPFDVERAVEKFHEAHERLYGYAYREREVIELVNWKVTGVGMIERPPLKPPAAGGSSGPRAAAAGRFRRDDLPAGFRGRGPVIIDEYGSTTVVRPEFGFEVDRLGNLVLRRMRDGGG